MFFEVAFYGEDPKNRKKYSIDMYFKHEKVIKLNDYDEDVRNKLI